MGFPLSEFNDLVFDGRAISRTGSLNFPVVKWRPIQVPTNDVVCTSGRVRYPARHLFHMEWITVESEYFAQRRRFWRQETESWRRFIAPLHLTFCKINRAAGDPTGGSRLKATRFKSKLANRVAQSRACIRHSPARARGLTHVEKSSQERSGGEDDCLADDRHTKVRFDTGNIPFSIDDDPRNVRLFDVQAGRAFQDRFHAKLVGFLVALN